MNKCSRCGIEMDDHGYDCGERVSEIRNRLFNSAPDPAREILRRLVEWSNQPAYNDNGEFINDGGLYPILVDARAMFDSQSDPAREATKPGPATEAMLILAGKILPWTEGKMNGPGCPENAAIIRAFLAEHGWGEKEGG